MIWAYDLNIYSKKLLMSFINLIVLPFTFHGKYHPIYGANLNKANCY